MSAIDALVDRLPRTTLVIGKGGVGKTTCAAALALRSARRLRVLLLSTDPVHALASVLDHPVTADAAPVPGAPHLDARRLDAGALRSAFVTRWGDVIRLILDRGTYLDASDIGPLVDTALPGSDEIFAMLSLAELLGDERSPYARVVVDTAPTGHTVRLLSLPQTFRALVRLLEAMQEKHRFMVRTLTRRYRADDADAFLREMTRLATALEAVLVDPARCSAVAVTNDQSLVLGETTRYLETLGRLRVHVSAVVWNGVTAAAPLGLPQDTPQYVVPRLAAWPVGIAGLTAWSDAMRPARPAAGSPFPRAARLDNPVADGVADDGGVASDLVRPLTIVAGKGGVGKTTVAAALGIATATHHRTLVVSTDPAPSLGDALAQPIPDADTSIAGAARLTARQMDATAAFERLRLEYRSRVDAMFDAVVARGAELAHDRAITRDLLALAPPGIDEVYALSLISDALFKDRYARVIVDPAPTGHLLRLLEMPQLALVWTHQLMRLMLKYKDVAGLGDAARDLLEFSRSLRALDAMLHDAAQCGVVIVTLDEPVVRQETERLASEVRRLRVNVTGVVVNRATAAHAAPGAGLPVPPAAVQFEAPAADPPPIGVATLSRWTGRWKRLPRNG